MKWHSAIDCRDMYQNLMADDTTSAELGGVNWVCPKVDTISIRNDPATYKAGSGISFNLIVNTCETAKRIDEEWGLTS